jgi:hypothetical protein
MTFRTTRLFSHRHNRDDTHDSICILCYATVASVQNEADLAQFEHDHVCEIVFLNTANQPRLVPSQHSSGESDEQP